MLNVPKHTSSCLPMFLTDDNEEVIESIVCNSISGNRDYQNEMPKSLYLVRKTNKIHIYMKYVQKTDKDIPTQPKGLINRKVLFPKHYAPQEDNFGTILAHYTRTAMAISGSGQTIPHYTELSAIIEVSNSKTLIEIPVIDCTLL